jgi:hypothetical protein
VAPISHTHRIVRDSGSVEGIPEKREPRAGNNVLDVEIDSSKRPEYVK